MKLALLLPGLTPLLVLLSVRTDASVEDWPCWRGGDLTGISLEDDWSSEGRDKDLWRVDVGIGYSSPSIADGRLYTKGFDLEDKEDVIRCLDALTGEEKWRHSYASRQLNTMHEGGTLTTPAVVDDRVYVLSRLGVALCLDAVNGKPIWTRNLAEELEVPIEPFGLSASPVIVEDMVLVNAGKTAALDRTSGEILWETKDYGYSYGTPMPFKRDGELLLAVFNAAGLVVLDAILGEEVLLFPWTTKFNVNAATPIILDGGDRVFISTGYDGKGCALLDITADEAEVIWASKTMRNKMSGCVLVDGYLYGFDDKVLKCLDLEGNEKWVQRGLGNGAVSASADRLLVVSEKGDLIVAKVSPEGFEVVSRVTLFKAGVCWAPPVLSNGLIYCRNNKGELVCRDHRKTAVESKQ